MNRAAIVGVSSFVLWACTSPAQPSDGPRLVPQAEISERKAEVWKQFEQDGPAWEAERSAVMRDPELSRFLIDNLIMLMVRSYERAGLAQVGQGVGPFERSQAELVACQKESTPVLVQMLSVKDGIVSFLAANTLEEIGAPAVEPVVRVLEDSRPEVRRRAAHLLGQLPNAGAQEAAVLEKLGDRVAHDEAWVVRAEAAQALGERGARNTERGYAVSVLARALNDPDPAVAQSAAQALEAAGDRRAIPVLIRALDQAVRQGEPKSARTIDAALKKLSGETRDRDAEAWSAWWQEEGSKPKPRGH
jgi:hypothetical protein